jgi:transcriptional regulator with XRE-family HTH domain/tetratricopeptide (TPR) repeat protein
MLAQSLGAMLRAYRVAANLTQEELAERALISPTAVAALERGRRRAPRPTTLRQLAHALDLNPEQLTRLAEAARTGEEGRDEESGAEGPSAWSPQPRAAPSALPTRTWRSAFVGRGDALSTLLDAWSARRRLVVIAGESGVGKTRLTSHWATLIRELGATVAWGRCREAHLGPYLPFVEIVRQLVAFVTQLSTPAIAELSRLVPELASATGERPVHAEAGTEQRVLFDAVVALLTAVGPIALVVDDLQWADASSLSLLDYVATSRALDDVVIAATMREPVEPALLGRVAELGRRAVVQRVTLPGLDHGPLGDLVAEVVGAPATSSLVDVIAASTSGNPFFAEELASHVLDEGLLEFGPSGATLRVDADRVGVPGRVRDALGGRLAVLPTSAVDFLVAGSLVGLEFTVALAASVAELDAAAAVDATDDGLLSGLIVEGEPGIVAFPHALVQEAVREHVSFTRRASIHRRIARALEASWDGDASAASELARHWGVVALVDSSAAPAAARWSVCAGDLALEAAATAEAIARYEDACKLWEESTASHADAMIRLAGACAHAGYAEQADSVYRDALRLAMSLRDPVLQARAAIGLGRRMTHWDTDRERIDLLEAALAALHDDGATLALILKGKLVSLLVNGFTEEDARRRDELASGLAEVASDPTTSDDVLLAIGATRFFDVMQDPDDVVTVARRVAEVATGANDLRVLAGTQFVLALAALDRADGDELRRVVSGSYRELSERLGDPRELGMVATAASTIATIEGRYDEGAELSELALGLGRASGDLNADLVHFSQGLLRGVDLGQTEVLLTLLLAAVDYHRLPSVTAGIALCAALAGDEERAAQALRQHCEHGFDSHPIGADRLAPAAFLAQACGIVGDVRAATLLRAELETSRALAVRVGPMIGWWGPVAHHLGVVCRVQGDLGAAEAHLRRALSLERSMNARPFEARTKAGLARVLMERHTRADEARRLAEESLLGAARLNAPGLEREVASATAS